MLSTHCILCAPLCFPLYSGKARGHVTRFGSGKSLVIRQVRNGWFLPSLPTLDAATLETTLILDVQYWDWMCSIGCRTPVCQQQIYFAFLSHWDLLPEHRLLHFELATWFQTVPKHLLLLNVSIMYHIFKKKLNFFLI